MPESYYKEALKLGQKEFQSCKANGVSPYLPALDDLIPSDQNTSAVSLGLVHIPIKQIVSTGGGAKSPLWCQMKADLTGKQVCLPKDKEAACLGAAMIGAVSEKVYGTFDDAVKSCIQMETVYEPKNTKAYEIKRKLYDTVYQGVQSAYDLMPATED